MIKHFFKYLIGDISIKLLGFISLPLYTHFLLPKDYGLYSLIISYVTIAIVVLPLNVHASISRFLYEKSLNVDLFMKSTFVLTTVIMSISALILWLIDPILLSDILEFDVTKFGLVALALVLTRIIFNIYKQTLIPKKKSKEYMLILVIKTYLSFGMIVLSFFMFAPDPLFMLIAVLLAEGVISLYVLYRLREFLRPKIDLASTKYILNYSVFLMPYVLSSVMMSQIDSVMLAKFFSTREVGIYNIAFVFSMIPVMIFTAFSNAWTPNYFKYMNEKNYDRLREDIKKIMLGVSLMVFLLALFAREVLWVLVDAKYQEAVFLLPMLSLSVFFIVLWQMWGRGISYIKKTIWTSVIGIISAVLNFFLNFYLIPLYEMQGAVVATLLSHVFMAFSGYFVSKHILKIYTVHIKHLGIPFFVCLLTLILCFIDNQVVLNSIKICVIFVSLFVAIWYKKMIVTLIKSFLHKRQTRNNT